MQTGRKTDAEKYQHGSGLETEAWKDSVARQRAPCGCTSGVAFKPVGQARPVTSDVEDKEKESIYAVNLQMVSKGTEKE
ncbi:hypothetical protein PRBEI_2001212000 [Prionailurus iriomotensis]